MPSLENRKIYAAGRSLAITLPKGWLSYFGLKAGDEVQIVANGELVIRPFPRDWAESPESTYEE
jgi:antitoxin component of MazEF toxin-antitoxin module